MADRRRKIWPWVLYAVIVVTAFVLLKHGYFPGTSVTHRRAVIVNDEAAIRREIDETVKKAERVRALARERDEK